MQNDEWLTPPPIIKALGVFDLDPCSPVGRIWDTAKKHYSLHDNGLLQEWEGRVWLNPPYGKYIGEWMNKMALHGNGIALVFARTDTGIFQESIFRFADGLFFLKGRVKFLKPDGKPGNSTSGAPSVLVAYGKYNDAVLATCGLKGRYVSLEKFLTSVDVKKLSK
jgi:hypothetical protein